MKRSTMILTLIAAAMSSYGFGTTPYRVVDVKEGGTIAGVVRLAGALPKRVVYETGKDPDWCGTRKMSPRLVVGANGGVANAVICLEGVTQGKRFVRKGTYVLDQRRCEYVPHILLLPAGADFDIMNSDAVLHNVHMYAPGKEARTVFNIAQPIKGSRFQVKGGSFAEPGAYQATCDAGHPWMSAYVVIAEHPYYTVTDTTGRFELKEVPPGTYTVKLWHEGVAVTKTEKHNGKVTAYHYEVPYEDFQQVTVSRNGTTTADFVLSLRAHVYSAP